MRMYHDPEVLGLRVRAKLGGVPFHVTFTVAGKKDALVLDGTGRRYPLLAERSTWGGSEYSVLDQRDALAKLSQRITGITVMTAPKRGEGKPTTVTLSGWKELVAWLADAPEKIMNYPLRLPPSTFAALRAVAQRQDPPGTIRDVIAKAIDEYLERYG